MVEFDVLGVVSNLSVVADVPPDCSSVNRSLALVDIFGTFSNCCRLEWSFRDVNRGSIRAFVAERFQCSTSSFEILAFPCTLVVDASFLKNCL